MNDAMQGEINGDLEDWTPMKDDGSETEPTSRFEKSKALSVHLDYCSEQLSKFEMEESDEEENINVDT